MLLVYARRYLTDFCTLYVDFLNDWQHPIKSASSSERSSVSMLAISDSQHGICADSALLDSRLQSSGFLATLVQFHNPWFKEYERETNDIVPGTTQ